MKINHIKLNNIKCFSLLEIHPSPGLNLFVGANNSGKSTLLNGIMMIQQDQQSFKIRKRIGANSGEAIISFSEGSENYFERPLTSVSINTTTWTRQGWYEGVKVLENPNISQTEPKNFLIPFQSRRKVTHFNESITIQDTQVVNGTFSNLYAKVDRISNPDLPSHERFARACKEILGFKVSSVNSIAGKKAAYIIDEYEHVSIDEMGEGVANILALVVDLCKASGKCFLIEEPENDIHPKALKALLDLIIEKSSNNQFFITTHSNVVVRYLASAPSSKLFQIQMAFDEKIPKSSILEVTNHDDRFEVLSELGYEFHEIGVWEKWIFFEESSIESLVNQFLIPFFVPELAGKVKTFSSNGKDQIEPKFDNFNNAFVYAHLTPAYLNKAWVIIDDGESEREIIEKLRVRYSSWDPENFIQLSRHDFEDYYPARFSDKVSEIKTLSKNQKRSAKQLLLVNVLEWMKESPEEARLEISSSAKELIDILHKIARS